MLHDRDQQHLDNIKRHRMKLILELPPEGQKEPNARMSKTFARWMSFAVAAKEVFAIAPNTNPYWAQWESYVFH